MLLGFSTLSALECYRGPASTVTQRPICLALQPVGEYRRRQTRSVGRQGGTAYSRTTARFDLPRPG